MRLLASLAALGAAVVPAVSHAQGPPPIADEAFVRADGVDFSVGGEAFHIVGANAAVMHGPTHRGAMPETLAAAADDGLSVVRIWALGEYPEDAPAWTRDYAFRVGPEGFVDASYDHLAETLAEARRLGLRVIVVLANRWGDYGGVSAYLRWSGLPLEARHVPSPGLGAFFTSAECEAAYRAHVRRVVERHRDDPTVFAWELMNEVEAAGVEVEESMQAWVARQAAFVHALDPNHLVSAGHIGYAGARDRALFRAVCELDGVDYCDAHAYPLRHDRVRGSAELDRWIDDRVQLARFVVQKPLLFGEIGVRTDRRRVRGRPSEAWIERFVERAIADGAGGALVWSYLPSGGPRRPYGIYTDAPRAGETRPFRRALGRVARRARRLTPRTRNGRLGPRRGDAPIFDPTRTRRGEATVHRGWDAGTLRVDPRRFGSARFEASGTHDGDPGPPHFWGSGAGAVRYAFAEPPERGDRLTVRIRASSELPGAGDGASGRDTSTLRISVDGVSLGQVVAPPDDGIGAWLELELDADALPRRRTHQLVIEADAEWAGGLCLYASDEHGAPAGIELRAGVTGP